MQDIAPALGGYPGLLLVVTVSYVFGPVVNFFVNITSGQATLIVGLLGLAWQIYRTLRERRERHGK